MLFFFKNLCKKSQSFRVSNTLWNLIWIQTVCKGHQQSSNVTLVGKNEMLTLNIFCQRCIFFEIIQANIEGHTNKCIPHVIHIQISYLFSNQMLNFNHWLVNHLLKFYATRSRMQDTEKSSKLNPVLLSPYKMYSGKAIGQCL